MPAILAVGVERLAIAKVMEEVVELSTGTEKSIVAGEAGILMAKARIQMEAGATETRTTGVKHTQLSVISSTTLGN